ncbi:baseplate J/gp47 family protein [Acidocella sp.]|uniref:baseplate J/gp47 family protein n=1 Tax=Acidocella sp. TaxID=50710 RepID=UPI00261D8CAF|nr:baseplate J/gp47 family protein [Acidocella sp.]
MPFARPTLTQLRNQAMQDVNTSPLGADGFLRFSVMRVLSWVQAGLAYLHYGYLDWISEQAVPWSAADEYLTGWGNLIGVPQEDATFASGYATMSGLAGTPIPGGTQFALSNGTAYLSTAAVSIAAGATSVNVPMTAVVAGSAGNADAGTVIKLSTPIAGITTSGVVAALGFTGGADQESPDHYRTRVLEQYAAPPQGGDRSDYIEWALAVGGVTRAWVTPQGQGPGTVVVYTMFDTTEAAFGGFPQGANGVAANETRDASATGDQLTVANAIYATQPVDALVYSCAPVKTPVNFTVANLGTGNTAANQAAIEAALTDMFLQSAQVGGSVDPATGAQWPALDPSAWYAAINSVGLSGFAVTGPSGPLTPAPGELFVLGTTTFAT